MIRACVTEIRTYVNGKVTVDFRLFTMA
jgi:hypothetical protein